MLPPVLILALASLTTAAKQLYNSYDFDPLQHLSGVAPYFEPADPPRDPNPPEGCTVTRAAYLVRHAAINANDFDFETYIEPFLEKLGNRTVDWSKISSLSFLSDWVPPAIVEEEQLTRTGKLEAAQLGLTVSYRYPNLRLPERVWASTAERTVKSAEGFIRGLEVEDGTINLVEVYEGEEDGANSLTTYESCPKYSSSSGSKQEAVSVSEPGLEAHFLTGRCRHISIATQSQLQPVSMQTLRHSTLRPTISLLCKVCAATRQ